MKNCEGGDQEETRRAGHFFEGEKGTGERGAATQGSEWLRVRLT
jgi:hypothetical protein